MRLFARVAGGVWRCARLVNQRITMIDEPCCHCCVPIEYRLQKILWEKRMVRTLVLAAFIVTTLSGTAMARPWHHHHCHRHHHHVVCW